MAAGALFRRFLRAAHHSGLNFPGHQSAACCWTRRVNVLSRLWAGWVCSRAVVCRSESDKFTTRRHQYTCGLSSLPSAVWLVVQWRFSIATLVDADRAFWLDCPPPPPALFLRERMGHYLALQHCADCLTARAAACLHLVVCIHV